MSIQKLGLSQIQTSLVALDHCENIGNEEMVQIQLKDGRCRSGRVVQIQGDKAIVQVFEGTDELAKNNTKTKFLGHPMELGVSNEILGRVFNGLGEPIDNLGPVFVKKYADVNGKPLNPVSRQYPRNYINTGISAIDGLNTLIRGQKLPIFSGSGLPHDQLAIQIVRQAHLTGDDAENFCIVFGAMGVKKDVADIFQKSFKETGVMEKVCMYLNLADDPILERIMTPRLALTAAEYLAFEQQRNVLVILTDMTAYCEAIREFSSTSGEIPSRKGYPGYLYSDLASLYERAGIIQGGKGSVTQIPILTMPNDDITHPVPDLTGYITEGQIVLDRDLFMNGIQPPIAILSSLSRLMKDGIGEGLTRKDHQAVANQLFASYSRVQEVRSLASVIGEDELSVKDRQYMKFARQVEAVFIGQKDDNRSIIETLDLAWALLSTLPKEELDRLDDAFIQEYYNTQRAQNVIDLAKKGAI
ncbi:MULTISPECIES: V-type ATP synthase subunit B [Terrabacteria group]|uniref:V-type ATP synthase subunit B n=1 Tax=Bacillati TaxID=1783272 RepID=UPI00193AC03F|nr:MULTISPECIES: V-type ATP synthase subunit B [Terrabacteria group]MBW9212320.1 V-type ATP synthase subunit B [Trueperella sp. zg.1013]QRG86143.1 V-type ATP synthase subunit B [Bulleidia sp. zg-1006]